MLSKEPVVILDLVKYTLVALTVFGVSLKPEQTAAIIGLAGALLAVATAYTRSRVSPSP
jgi:hypothetical protein